MIKTKAQKGITLVALIITIIILLILAVVAIRAVQGDGILKYAQNAKEGYEKAEDNERATLDGYLSEIEGSIGAGGAGTEDSEESGNTSVWVDNGDGTFSKGTTKVEIGDYVNYNEGSSTHTPDTAKGAGTSKTGGNETTGYTLGTSKLTTEDLKWRVLGVNKNGQLELISAEPTQQELYLANDEGYINAEENLNNFCNDLYGNGENVTGARSLNADDIIEVFKSEYRTDSSYGEKWTYRYPTQEQMDAFTGTENSTRYMQYRVDKPDGTVVKDWTNLTDLMYQTFRTPYEETSISSTNPRSVELLYSSCRFGFVDIYYEDPLGVMIAGEPITELVDENSNTYLTHFPYNYNWLATKTIYSNEETGMHYVYFSVCSVDNGIVERFWSYSPFGGQKICKKCAVRPVVSLKSNVSLSGTGEGQGSLNNMWQIS